MERQKIISTELSERDIISISATHGDRVPIPILKADDRKGSKYWNIDLSKVVLTHHNLKNRGRQPMFLKDGAKRFEARDTVLVAVCRTGRAAMRDSGLLTRDGRMKERKKYGLRGARRGTQFSKR